MARTASVRVNAPGTMLPAPAALVRASTEAGESTATAEMLAAWSMEASAFAASSAREKLLDDAGGEATDATAMGLSPSSSPSENAGGDSIAPAPPLGRVVCMAAQNHHCKSTHVEEQCGKALTFHDAGWLLVRG
jgi:hypothetical protein